MTTRRQFGKQMLAAALAGPAAVSQTAYGEEARGTAGNPLILETGFDAGELLYVVGSQKGFFKQKGLETSLRKVLTAADATQALVNGYIDAVSGTEIPMLGARMNRGENIRILGTMGSSNTQFAAILSSKIKTVGQLADPGTKIGVSQGSGGQYWLYAYAKANKLDYSKLNIVFVAPNGMVGAFRNGEIDAMFTWQPIATMGLNTVPGARLLAHGGDNGVFQAQQYIVVNQHIWSNPQVLRPFLETMIYTGNWIEANKDESVKILSDFLQTGTSTFAANIAGYDYRVKFSQAQVDQLKGVYKFIREINPTAAAISDWSFVDPAPLRSIDASIVTVQSA